MSNNDGALAQLETASKLAPAGFALAGHFTKMRPSFMLQCYPKDWTAFYAKNSLAMVDPAIAWGLANEGTFRWSDFDAARCAEDHDPLHRRAAFHIEKALP